MKRLKISPRLNETKEEMKKMVEKSVILLVKKLLEILPSTEPKKNQPGSPRNKLNPATLPG